jgi:hypothetical protein
MGPFALGDLVGLDVLESIRADLERAYGDRFDDAGTVAVGDDQSKGHRSAALTGHEFPVNRIQSGVGQAHPNLTGLRHRGWQVAKLKHLSGVTKPGVVDRAHGDTSD